MTYISNIFRKMNKFANDTKLCHRDRNPDGIMELREDINKLVEWANKWQMSLNKKVKSSMARSLPVENLLPQNVGSIINYLQ